MNKNQQEEDNVCVDLIYPNERKYLICIGITCRNLIGKIIFFSIDSDETIE